MGFIKLSAIISLINPWPLKHCKLCITRQMITAVKNATRQKHIPLNSYISLNRRIFDEESDKTYIELVPDDVASNPEQLIIKKEEFSGIENKMWKILSPFEWMVLSLYLNGKTYVEIARKVKAYKIN